ncbi:putative ATP-dependent helicase-like protein [Hapsidospora chrysogenum ATCC 11550]|uniref:Putative ATP-dependent helicase-like protein n=1 Tax=Hapsidospora chrysogenum (strain ATCC 11550 / CBS 779.69 / DSM 880 / IAM 14645 / JCM 23072 / IMI 49137) TaxID=857340 RepID=A0A086T1R9_HAPC1|nr:putative ATP-dependent helicase-like protein [Hapsidospora chrysogenum ATCC 11550]
MIEMDNEVLLLKRFNDRRYKFRAWPVAPLPGFTTSFTKSWLLLVKTPPMTDDIDFPALGDNFSINMEAAVERKEGSFSLVHLFSTRIPNPYEELDAVGSQVKKCAAFKVDVPRSWKTEDGLNFELDLMSNFQVASSIDDFASLTLGENSQNITIQWDTASVTSNAELAALRHLIEEKRVGGRVPSARSLLAFKTIQDFHGTKKTYLNLHQEFPHLRNPVDPFFRIPQALQAKFKAFNEDHRRAYHGLTMISNGLYFVNGCPGAGKTEWNMVLSALIQSRKRGRSNRRYSPILFLVDINKTVDDAADRYFKLCKDVGLNRRILRMHGWPYEMRNSDKLHQSGRHLSEESEPVADFTKRFLTTASLAQHAALHRNPDKAPTLDEASWEYFERHKKGECFSLLAKILGRMESGESLGSDDWKALRSSLGVLYRAVLAQADFIATTPVAAYGRFPSLFRPEVIFFDEAPHARELTTLIPIAYFDPLVWIFTGDVNQTQPFVKGGNERDMERQGLKLNPFADQLRMSTMARAAVVGALDSHLLVNKRAYGNLHRLPSVMFYQGQMRSEHKTPEAMYPPSTTYLRDYLRCLGRCKNTLNENRVVVELESSAEQMHRTSYWNPGHHQWVLEQAERLLKDEYFRSVTHAGAPGSIMIESPYRTAVRQYETHVRQLPEEWQNRVEAVTVDKAQGKQADVVILDMVRTSKVGFMDKPQRLNVAITRARQAEIIVMHHAMTVRTFRGQVVKTRYTSQLWEDAMADERVFRL